LIEKGHSLNDILYVYTIEQVYLLYEKAKKIELDNNKMLAIILGKSLYCMSPSYTQQEASRKNREWNSFINKLDFEILTKPKDIKQMFASAGIPIIKPKKDSNEVNK